MTEITLKIDGMQCGMCETHINNVVRNAVKVKKITSSHKKNETVIIADDEIDKEKPGGRPPPGVGGPPPPDFFKRFRELSE